MRRILLLFVAMLGLMLLATMPAQAGVVYDNSCGSTGCSNGFNAIGWTIDFGFAVSDTFIDSGQAFSGIDFWVWADPGDSITDVDWAIGTSAFGNDIASGTAAVTTTTLFTNNDGYNIQQDWFGIPGLTLNGTYYLTLQNAVVPSGDPIYWDQSDGPSAAFESEIGSLANCGEGASTTCSESFDLTGPEPDTLALIGGGLLVIGGLIRRKTQR